MEESFHKGDDIGDILATRDRDGVVAMVNVLYRALLLLGHVLAYLRIWLYQAQNVIQV